MVSSFDCRMNVSEERQESEVWNTKVAAEMYGKSERTIRRLLKNGVIEGYKIEGPFGPEWRIKPDARAMCTSGPEGSVESFRRVDRDKEKIARLESRIAEMEQGLHLQKDYLPVKRQYLAENHSSHGAARSRIATTVSQFWQSVRSTISRYCSGMLSQAEQNEVA